MRRRPREVGRIAAYLKRYQSPRTQLFLILLLTGFVGAAASYLLLRLGVSDLWLRYPLAALLAYGGFILFLRSWVRSRIARPGLAEEIRILEPEPPTPAKKPSGTSEFKLSDLMDGIDVPFPDDEGCLLLSLGLVIAVILVVAIVTAPMILAELLLDGMLVAGLWRRLRRNKRSTVRGAIRATVVPALIVVLCLGLIGYLLQHIEPSADSIGDLFRSP